MATPGSGGSGVLVVHCRPRRFADPWQDLWIRPEGRAGSARIPSRLTAGPPTLQSRRPSPCGPGTHVRSETSMRKLLALGLGATLLVVGAGAVLAQNASPSGPAARPAASAAPSAGAPSTTGVAPKVRGDGLLDKVLKDLV